MSAEMEIVFADVDFQWEEISDKEHEEFLR